MKIFSPADFGPLPEKLTAVPKHGVAWPKKFANWWAGATIASPTTEAAAPAGQSILAVRKFLGDIDRLNEYYVDQTEYLRWWVRRLLSLPESTPVILDASGTSAILVATRMLAHVAASRGAKTFYTVTTSEEGSLVAYTLKGKDPNTVENVMFFPASSLFFEAAPALPYPEHVGIGTASVSLADHDNVAVVEQIRKAVVANSGAEAVGAIVLPTVSKSGRILPVREVAALVETLKAQGHKLYLVVDDVQGMGRRDAESIVNPLSYADAYLFSASKALGGLLIASAVAMREEHVSDFVSLAASNKLAPQIPCVAHFQFEPRFENLLPEWIMKKSAVSIPELVAMHAVMMHHYHRGDGETYSQRRLSQLALVGKQRRKVVEAITAIPGVHVLEALENRPLVPSIISMYVDRPGATPMKVKKALQEATPIVTPTAPVGRYLRLDIPEYRSVPSEIVLASTLARVLETLGR